MRPWLSLLPIRAVTLAGLLAAAGCETTGNPNEDSIGFRWERAERERLAPRRERLAQEHDSTEAERIRSVTLHKRIDAEESAQRATRSELRRVQAQRAAAQHRLCAIEEEMRGTGAQAGEDRALIARRDRAQAEVDRLTHILQKILDTE